MKPAVISLFSGVGGLDFGFEAAGFRTAVAVELDQVCCDTIQKNRSWPVLQGDIHNITSREILRIAGLKRGQVDVLIGGPPCQPFSKSGYWSNGDSQRLDDPRANTLTAYLRLLRETKPKVFLLENVRGLTFSGKDEGLRFLLDGIEEVNRHANTNYKVHWKVVDAASYGVPQHRERVFLIGSQNGRAFHFPEPSHGEHAKGEASPFAREPYRTAWDALGDLPESVDDPALEVGGKWGDLLPTIPEGENYLWHTNRGGGSPIFGWRRRYWNFLLKLSKNRPSWTIQAQPGTATGPFHWKNRRLSAQELCRLQTFPEGLLFDCARGDVQQMLGNAVPSLLAEVLALEIKKQLLRIKCAQRPLLLLPPARGGTPRRTPIRKLPEKYKPLIGEYLDHPGTGKGWGEKNSGRVSPTIY